MVRKPSTKKKSKKIIQEETKLQNEHVKEEESKKIQEYIDHLQRLQAEFDNYRKRAEQEKQLIIKQANQDLIQKLLIILDTFELAFQTQKEDSEFAKGMKIIFSETYSTLEKEGLKKIDCTGKKFDPNFHEVMLQEKSDKEEGIILEELQKGYMLNDRVIRFSKVKISNGGKEKWIK